MKALPFLPVAAVKDAWKMLRTQLVNKWPAANNFAVYFEKTWVESNVYNLSLWNCYEQTLARRPRTNVSEGGNNSIRIAYGVSNPIIWTCLDRIIQIQHESDCKIIQQDSGTLKPKKLRKKIRQREERILKIVSEYTEGSDVDSYLRRLSYLCNEDGK